jgi:hypothetical protein
MRPGLCLEPTVLISLVHILGFGAAKKFIAEPNMNLGKGVVYIGLSSFYLFHI